MSQLVNAAHIFQVHGPFSAIQGGVRAKYHPRDLPRCCPRASPGRPSNVSLGGFSPSSGLMQTGTNKTGFKDSLLPMDEDLGPLPGQGSPNSEKTICMLPLQPGLGSQSHFIPILWDSG